MPTKEDWPEINLIGQTGLAPVRETGVFQRGTGYPFERLSIFSTASRKLIAIMACETELSVVEYLGM